MGALRLCTPLPGLFLFGANLNGELNTKQGAAPPVRFL